MTKSQFSRRHACALFAISLASLFHGAQAQTVPLSKAEALVDKALSLVKANGKEAAFAEFNNPASRFQDGELYIYAYDFEGNCLALGVNPKLVGKNLLELKSSNGVYQIKELISQVKAKGSGTLESEFVNPMTKKVQTKVLIAKRIPGTDLFLGSGVYK